MKLNRMLWTALAVLCALAAAKGAWDLFRVLKLEASGAIESDSLLYFTVGRGIVNGLTPYAELFESKPPGMFLLAAASLLTTGNELLALVLQLLILIAIPILLAVFGWSLREGSRMTGIALAFLGAGIGILLSLYLEERAGGIQTESFGSIFVILYALLVHRYGEYLTKRRMLILGLLILCAVGMKEPFALPIVGCALLLAQNGKHLLKALVIPSIGAGVLGAIILLVTGWWGAYADLYLPAMFGAKINVDPIDALWLRGFRPGVIFGNLTTYYTAPMLGYVLGALWLLSPLTAQRMKSRKDILLTAGTLAVAYNVFLYGYFFLVTWNVHRLGLALQQSIVPISGFTFALIVLALGVLLFFQWKSGLLGRTLLALAAMYIAALAAGISVYAVNHFAFPFPMYFTVALLFLALAARTSSALIVLPVAALTVIGLFAYAPSEKHLQALTERFRYASKSNMETVARADALLESCDVDRYGAMRTYADLAFARHSPLGPLLEKGFFEFLGKDHALWTETDRRILEKADVIFVRDPQGFESIQQQVNDRFTEIAPPCAQPHMPISGLKVLFRKV